MIEILVPNIYLFTLLLQNWLQNGQKVWEIQIFVLKMQKKFKKSRQKLKNLEESQQSQFISTISIKISTQINLDPKVSILKILTKKKNNLVSTVGIIFTGFKSWSRQIKKSWSRSRLVSTVQTPKLSFTSKIICF